MSYPGSNLPTGMISPFAGNAAPTGFLLCQGQAVSRSTYGALWGVCGTTYGAGDGKATFNLPDLRGRVPLGPDPTGQHMAVNAPSLGGTAGGEEQHTLIVNELATHNHGGYYISVGSGAAVNVAAVNFTSGATPAFGDTVDNTGASAPHNNVQPYLSLNFIIKT